MSTGLLIAQTTLGADELELPPNTYSLQCTDPDGVKAFADISLEAGQALMVPVHFQLPQIEELTAIQVGENFRLTWKVNSLYGNAESYLRYCCGPGAFATSSGLNTFYEARILDREYIFVRARDIAGDGVEQVTRIPRGGIVLSIDSLEASAIDATSALLTWSISPSEYQGPVEITCVSNPSGGGGSGYAREFGREYLLQGLSPMTEYNVKLLAGDYAYATDTAEISFTTLP